MKLLDILQLEFHDKNNAIRLSMIQHDDYMPHRNHVMNYINEEELKYHIYVKSNGISRDECTGDISVKSMMISSEQISQTKYLHVT